MELIKQKSLCSQYLEIGLYIEHRAHTAQDYTCADLGDLKKQSVDSEGQRAFADTLVC